MTTLQSGGIKIKAPEITAAPALLVLDLQKYFFSPQSHAFIPSAPAIIPGIIKLIHTFRGKNMPVLFTRHINSMDNAGRMDNWWQELITAANPLSAFVTEIEAEVSTEIVKSQYDAFFMSSLDGQLKQQGISQVIVTGVMTHLCCETTARSAFVHGYDVVFPVDGSATYNADFHRSSLRNLAHGFASLTTTDDFVRQLSDL